MQRYRFSTARLDVDGWHEWPAAESGDLADVLTAMLTPATTQELPSGWQGSYDRARALDWIEERDEESTTLLVVDRDTSTPIGLMILFEIPTPDSEGDVDLRLGYLLAESAWGSGYASELVAGFVNRCRSDGRVRSIAGGVGPDNHASARVLTKNGFVSTPSDESGEQLYELILKDGSGSGFSV